MQYWDELGYAVCNKNRVLAQIQCRLTEHNPVWGHHYSTKKIDKAYLTVWHHSVNPNAMLYGLSGVLTKMQTKSIPYTFNRCGYYYFSHRVPSDLKGHYSYPRVVQGLCTRSPSQTKTRALIAAAKLDEYWCRLRMTDPDLLGSHLFKDPRTANHTASDSISSSSAINL